MKCNSQIQTGRLRQFDYLDNRFGPIGSIAVSDTGLTASTAYSYTVSAIDAAGNESSQSSSAGATTTSGTTSDSTAPSVPTGVNATATAWNSVTVSWSASSDNVAVTGYVISRGGTPLSRVAGSVTSFTDRSTAVSTSYSYTVTALDAAGNASSASSAGSDTTPADDPPVDTTDPSVPTDLTATAVSDVRIDLSWAASTDDVGVQGYTVRRDGTPIGVVSSPSFSDTTAAAGTTYEYTVSAADAATNASAETDPVEGTTLAWPITTTGYTYDLADRMVGITAPTSPATTFSIDALGRHFVRSIDDVPTDTYTYLGSSEAIVRIASLGGSIDSAVDSLSDRVATATSDDDFGWLLPDLHGDAAAALDDTGATVTDAFRYDAYGETIASTESSLPSPWRYQGRLLLGDDADSDLYDFVFRSYDPSLGAFLSLDDVKGSAQNPITFNRFLYAGANPATLIDPDGHCFSFNQDGGFDLFGTLGHCGGASLGFVVGSGESLVGLGSQAAGGVYAAPGHLADIGRCVADVVCANETTQGILLSGAQLAGEINTRGQSVLADPEAAARRTTSTLALAGAGWIGREHDLLTKHGGFDGGREAGRIFGSIEGVGLTSIYAPVLVSRTIGATTAAAQVVRRIPAAISKIGEQFRHRPAWYQKTPPIVLDKAKAVPGGVSCPTCPAIIRPPYFPRGTAGWAIDHIIPWRFLKRLAPPWVVELFPGWRKWLYNLQPNLRLRCAVCNSGDNGRG